MMTLTMSPKTSRLERLTRLIEQTLGRALPEAGRKPPVLHEAMRYCVLNGGKRFRPLLCLGACEAVGAPARRALAVACALEFLHAYSLVHDDLPAMDNADERRGQPTCHRKFGEANAILVGDALLTLAFEQLSHANVPNTRAILHTICQACGSQGLIGGQVLDLQMLGHPPSATESLLMAVAEWKTAALLRASVLAGALAGGGTPKQLALLRRYGQALGVAFQLIDDVHDGEGLAQAKGLDAARAEARRLIEQAVKPLAPFGRRAALLQQLAGWLASTIG